MRNQIAIIALSVFCLATAAMAQSDKAPATDCPAHYELIGGTLCMKASNGDIVLPTARTSEVRYTTANCAKGYEILLDDQCMNPSTGDIVFASVTSSAAQAAKK